jgi:hypothetical protein
MCTLFGYKTEHGYCIGKNYDVHLPCHGLLFWNPAGITKEALIKPPEEPVRGFKINDSSSLTC